MCKALGLPENLLHPPEAESAPSQDRMYELVKTIEECVWNVATDQLLDAVLDAILPNAKRARAMDGSAIDPGRLDQIKAAFSSPPHRHAILTRALNLMADQGEIYLSGPMAYLDPSAIAELVKPLVDHRIGNVHEYLSHGPGVDSFHI